MTGLGKIPVRRFFIQTVIAACFIRCIIGYRQREIFGSFFRYPLAILGLTAYVFVYRLIDAPEDHIGFVVGGGAIDDLLVDILWSMSAPLHRNKQATWRCTSWLPFLLMAHPVWKWLRRHGGDDLTCGNHPVARQLAFWGSIVMWSPQLLELLCSVHLTHALPLWMGMMLLLFASAAQLAGLHFFKPGAGAVVDLISGF